MIFRNGHQIAITISKFTIWRTAPLQELPVAKKPLIPIGVVQGTIIPAGFGTSPIDIVK